VPQFRIVLVRPETAANIGACARVARNTGAQGVDLVRPGDWRTLECWRSAWGAHEVLEQTRVFEDLADALAGASLSVALTGRRPTGMAPVEDVRVAAARVAALHEAETAALVFGPEASGLSNEEVRTCGRSAMIPSHPAQPSYNLSHAVAITAYEVHRALRPRPADTARRATHEEKQRLIGLLRAGLEGIRALPPNNAELSFDDWRELVQRADLTRRELMLLQHASRKMAAAGKRG
jgi:tRNA/rRNA methyltransferase